MSAYVQDCQYNPEPNHNLMCFIHSIVYKFAGRLSVHSVAGGAFINKFVDIQHHQCTSLSPHADKHAGDIREQTIHLSADSIRFSKKSADPIPIPIRLNGLPNRRQNT